MTGISNIYYTMSLGSCGATIAAKINKIGKSYSMDIEYKVQDYYDTENDGEPFAENFIWA